MPMLQKRTYAGTQGIPVVGVVGTPMAVFFFESTFWEIFEFQPTKNIGSPTSFDGLFFFSKPAKNIAKNQKKLKKKCNVFIILANKNCWLANKISWLFFLLKNSKKKCFLEKYLPTPFANFVGPAMAFFFSRQQREFPVDRWRSLNLLHHDHYLFSAIAGKKKSR